MKNIMRLEFIVHCLLPLWMENNLTEFSSVMIWHMQVRWYLVVSNWISVKLRWACPDVIQFLI